MLFNQGRNCVRRHSFMKAFPSRPAPPRPPKRRRLRRRQPRRCRVVVAGTTRHSLPLPRPFSAAQQAEQAPCLAGADAAAARASLAGAARALLSLAAGPAQAATAAAPAGRPRRSTSASRRCLRRRPSARRRRTSARRMHVSLRRAPCAAPPRGNCAPHVQCTRAAAALRVCLRCMCARLRAAQAAAGVIDGNPTATACARL